MIGLLLFFWSVKVTYEKQKVKASLDVEKQMGLFVSEFDEELSTSTELLYSLSSLLSTFGDLTPKQFEKFTSDLSTRKKGILIVEWQPKVLEEDRERFVKKARV